MEETQGPSEIYDGKERGRRAFLATQKTVA